MPLSTEAAKLTRFAYFHWPERRCLSHDGLHDLLGSGRSQLRFQKRLELVRGLRCLGPVCTSEGDGEELRWVGYLEEVVRVLAEGRRVEVEAHPKTPVRHGSRPQPRQDEPICLALQ